MIADDHQIFLDGMKSLLQAETGLEVIGEALNGREVLAQLDYLKPDVILLDIQMPEMNGLETAKQVKDSFPEVKLIVLSMNEKVELIGKLIESGVSGYLLKNSSRKILLEAINQVYLGETYFSEEVTKRVMQSFQKKDKGTVNTANIELTPREIDVLKLLTQEFTTSAIAEKLFISTHTVESHRKNLLSKLGKKNTAGLVVYAVQNGIA